MAADPPDFVIKAHDRLPSIQATLSTGENTVDLSPVGVAVNFILTSAVGVAPKVNAAAVLVDAASGIVRYDWAATDTNTPGSYLGEWQVTWPDGRKQTFPTESYHVISVLADLDNA